MDCSHGEGVCQDEQSPFCSTAATSSSRPRAVPDDARRSSQGRLFRAAAKRLGLELIEHVIMLDRSGPTGAAGMVGSVRASRNPRICDQGSSRFGDLGCLPDQTHIRSSREATAPGFRLRRAGSRERDHSSLRRLKPCNPSVRPPGSSEADLLGPRQISYGGIVACGRRRLPPAPVQAAGFITAPSMRTPWVTYFHKATRSLRASATIARLRPCGLRSLNQRVRADCGW